jgi:hypothetical protein
LTTNYTTSPTTTISFPLSTNLFFSEQKLENPKPREQYAKPGKLILGKFL